MSMNILCHAIQRIPLFIPLTALISVMGIFVLGGPLGTALAELLLRAPLLFGVWASVGLGAATIVQGPAAIAFS